MHTIHKLQLFTNLPNWQTQDLILPAGAIIRLVAEQRSELFLWYERSVKIDRKDKRVFEVFATGYKFEMKMRAFIGSVSMLDGTVWHVYERLELLERLDSPIKTPEIKRKPGPAVLPHGAGRFA